MSSPFAQSMTEFVEMAQDQTDGLVAMMNLFAGELATPTPQQWRLIISHMQLLQRSLAKSAFSEISTLEEIDKRLKKFEE